MPLVLDANGMLPMGVHDASMEEVEEQFARFQRSDRRMKLFAGLRAYAQEIKRAGVGMSIVINGSFVMASVDEPEDIDAVLTLPGDWDLAADLKPFQYNLVDRKSVRKAYHIDVYPVREGSVEQVRWLDFFSQVNFKWCRHFGWPADTKKGLVRVML
jgi:hypothetical protein